MAHARPSGGRHELMVFWTAGLRPAHDHDAGLEARGPMKRRTLLVSAAAAVAAPSIVRAQAWPANPIRVIHGYDAGSNPDTIARHLSVPLTEILGVQIMVEPK